MKKVLIPVLIGCLLITGLSIITTFARADTVVVLGEPSDDPVDDEPPQDDPTPPPPPPPEPILATVHITPKTINLKSRGHFITASIGLPNGFNVDQIDGNTVQISAVDEYSIEPILANKTMVSGIESDSCLLAKFARKDLINVLSPQDEVKITVAGSLTSGEEFTGDDTVRVIEPGKCFPANVRGKGFIFRLDKHLSSDAQILKALLWINYRKRGWSIKLWLRKFLHRNWSRLLEHRPGKHYFLPVTEGEGYEWDFTETVRENWNKGIYYVTISLDYDTQIANGSPALIVTYQGSNTLQETAIKKQRFKPIAPRFIFPGKRELVKLFFSDGDIQGIDTGDIVICGWNEATSRWEIIPDSTLDPVEQSVTTGSTGYTLYQIMSVSPSSSGGTDPGDTEDTPGSVKNSLGQNYPNPFNPSTTINYAISQDCHVTLKLYNICGQLVATIVDEYQQAGTYSKHFDAGDRLSRGIYYYQLKAGDFVDTKRMAILR